MSITIIVNINIAKITIKLYPRTNCRVIIIILVLLFLLFFSRLFIFLFVFQMLRDLYTFLEKAVPDTKLTLKKYSDAKFEFLVRYIYLFFIYLGMFIFNQYYVYGRLVFCRHIV